MRRRTIGLTLLAVVALVGAGAGCSDEPEAAPATTTAPEDGPTTTTKEKDAAGAEAAVGTIEWSACTGPGSGTDECGTLDVPLDYDDPAAGTITLSLVRMPARDPDRRIGPLLVNPGGPGASGLDYARAVAFPDDIADRFDIIGFDPRGVAASSGLTCGGDLVDRFFEIDSDPDAPEEQAQLDGAAEAIAADCAAEDGDLLAHVGSDNVARDMDSIRRALGEDQISYLGFSYGTLLGARYAELFPEHARAIVLDGVVDPAHDFSEWLIAQAAGFDRAVADVFAACPDDPSCPAQGAEAAYDEILARVEIDPLPAGGARLGPGDVATAVLFVTYDPSSWSDLYAGLGEALNGDGSRLYRLAENYRSIGAFTQYAAVECVDSPHPVGAGAYQAFAAQLEAVSPRFGAAVANELLACAFWPVDEVGEPRPVTAPEAPPILVIGNTGDAATPYEQAQRVAETLATGVLLTHEGRGHTSYLGGNSCVDGVVAAYLVDLATPEEGTVCR